MRPVGLAPAAAPRYDVYWRETQTVTPGQSLTDDLDCDICIVGAGYTGMWSAHFLKSANPSLDIQLLEADYAGAGASGHNDGFATGAIGGQSWADLASRYGPELATAAHREVARSVTAIYRFSVAQGICIDVEPLGFYQVATTPRQDQRLRADRALAARLSPSAKYPPVLDGPDIRARIGSPALISGVWHAGMLINPHKLARELARCTEEAGAAIHERTPVLSLRDDGRTIVLETPAATVRAQRVILATNAWQGQFAPFRRTVRAQWHYALVTAPLADTDVSGLNWRGREGFIEVRRPGLFGRLTADNRILFGGGPIYDYRDVGSDHLGKDTRRIELSLRKGLVRYFPMLSGTPIANFYGGAMGVTPDRMVRVGQLSERVFFAYGYSGNGIAASHLAGQLIRDIVLQKGTPEFARIFTEPSDKRLPSRPLVTLTGTYKTYRARLLGV